jgi:hypothetical protein
VWGSLRGADDAGSFRTGGERKKIAFFRKGGFSGQNLNGKSA